MAQSHGAFRCYLPRRAGCQSVPIAWTRTRSTTSPAKNSQPTTRFDLKRSRQLPGLDVSSVAICHIICNRLNWNNFYVLANTDAPNSGYANGAVSGTNVAYNGFGSQAVTSGSPFTFNSAYFTAAWNDGLNVTVTGFLLGSQVDQTTFTINTAGPFLETFDWTNVDTLKFDSSGGSHHAGFIGSGTHFAMDDFRFNEAVSSAVPLPSTAIVGLTLLGGCVGVQVLRRQKASQMLA